MKIKRRAYRGKAELSPFANRTNRLCVELRQERQLAASAQRADRRKAHEQARLRNLRANRVIHT